jgi:hypothetical protein
MTKKRENTRDTKMELPTGESDISKLRSVTREWLVPRLVEDFLSEQGVELNHVRKAGTEKRLRNT